MAEREMGIMSSPEDAVVWVEFVILAATTITFGLLFTLFLRRTVHRAVDMQPHIAEEGYFDHGQPWLRPERPDVAAAASTELSVFDMQPYAVRIEETLKKETMP